MPAPFPLRSLNPWMLAGLCVGCTLPALAQKASGPAAPLQGITAPHAAEAQVLVLEVQLDRHILSDSLTAYQEGHQILLPLGELARLLTLAIAVQPELGNASGYVLKEERTFGLNIPGSAVSLNGREATFEARLAQVIGDDLYVSAQLLSRWLPIDFEVHLPTMQLRVKPREKLPLQARLEREREAGRLGTARGESTEPGYALASAPYQFISAPFIDQTFGADLRRGNGTHQSNASYTAYMTADFAGLEGAAYVSSTSAKPAPDWRVTLGRNDPDARLLGPLQARSFSLGNISVPSVPNVMSGSPTGNGITVSNRRLDQPTSFDRQSLRGDLPPGWDVTLYYNEALIGFQPSRADGLYAFDDLPLSFGANEFVLVFNGPLGQMRSERRSFLLDQSIVKPGEFLYALTQHEADQGGSRSVGRFDFGLAKSVAGSAAFIRMPLHQTGPERTYSQLGLRGYWNAMILTSELTTAHSGGSLAELGLKTRLGSYAVDWLHTQVHGAFDSDAFAASGNPLRRRDKLRVVGAVTLPGTQRKLPMALDAQRDVLQSGATSDTVSGRLSATLAGTAITNGLNWQHTTGAPATLGGNLQLSRRVTDMGLSAQLGYSLKPDARVDSMALSADRSFNDRNRINFGVLRSFSGSPLTQVTLGASRRFDAFSLGVSGSYSSRNELTLGLQLFIALGRDPRTGQWTADALPLAGTGAVSARAFVDRNLNGVRDSDEEWVPNAGFLLNNGGRHPTRTDAAGLALINRLAPGRYTDIALDPGTLEDPQWKPVSAGVRVLPRPGLVQAVEFPVASTSEIDGTVSLLEKGKRRGIGDAVVELVDAQGNVVSQTKSASDGFYILHQVLPGRFTVRISPDQASKLKLGGSLTRAVSVPADGDFISGQDLELQLLKQ